MYVLFAIGVNLVQDNYFIYKPAMNAL